MPDRARPFDRNAEPFERLPDGWLTRHRAAQLIGINAVRFHRVALDFGFRIQKFPGKRWGYFHEDVHREARRRSRIRTIAVAQDVAEETRTVCPANPLRSRLARETRLDRPSLAPDNEEDPTTSCKDAAGSIVRVRDRDQRSLGPLTSTESLSAKDFRNVS